MLKGTIFFVSLCLLSVSCKNTDNTTSPNGTPQITAVTPALVNPGVQEVEGRIIGNNLVSIQSISLGEGVSLERFSPISASEIYIFFSVSRDAAPGPRNVVVATSAGAASSSTVFTVSDNRVPEAKFSVSPSQGLRGESFRFDGSGSNDDGAIVNYLWNFGDGKQSTGKVVTHVYSKRGTFQASLTVTDNENTSGQATRILDVFNSKLPVAQFSVSPSSGTTATSFLLDASPSRDPDGQIVRYSWSFGDGSGGNGVVQRHQFGRTGTLLVNLTVTDDSGESANSSRVVSIGVGPPVPPPPSQSGKCSVPAKGRQIHFFRVLSEDQSAKVITGQFLENVDCSDVFYLCGDVRLGGLSAGQKELWMGTICQMDDLGNNTFRFHLVGGKNWISVGEDETYVTPQFDCSPHIYCKSFGF